MKKILIWGIVSLNLLGSLGCTIIPEKGNSSGASGNPEFTAALWNVQALFDGEETGFEYRDYLDKAGWTEEKYRARIHRISEGILEIPGDVPDILCLVEVENLGILTDLAESGLSKNGYQWACFAGVPTYALGVGVLSRYPMVYSKAHSFASEREVLPRPVLEVRLDVRKKGIVFFLCHWKSKLGGDATEGLRRAAARVIRRRLEELAEEDPELAVVVLGDLNENHDEFYRRDRRGITALLPDDPDAAALADDNPADYLVISDQKPPRAEHFNVPVPLYSPWGSELEEGSYYYNGEWETIDHFLLNPGLFDSKGWEFLSCRVLQEAPFINAEGSPLRYNTWNGQGLSDHLPLVLQLRDMGP